MSIRTAKIWRDRRQHEVSEWKKRYYAETAECQLKAERIMAAVFNQSEANIGRFLYEPLPRGDQ